jgi:ligand-binding sensor domain-containing protein/signal transduction histidine kinase
MRCIVHLLTAIFLSASILNAQSIRIERISTKQGLSHGSVTSISQDNKGYLWFGTPNGLNRFDGYGFKVFSRSHTDSTALPNNIIRVIHQDEQGNIWLGIDNHGLIKFDPVSGQYRQYKHDTTQPDSLSHNDVYAITVDKQNNFWVGTYGGGLNLFDPDSGTFTSFRHKKGETNSLSDDYIQAMYADEEGMLWIGTERGGLNKFNPQNNTFQAYNIDTSGKKKMAPVWGICADDAGFLWLATDGDGLLRFDKLTAQFQVYKHNPATPQSLSHNNLTAIINDQEGNLWVGTWGGGLNKFNPRTGKAVHYAYHPYLPDKLGSSTIYTLFQDKSGLIWVGTNGQGVNHFNPLGSSFRTYAFDPGQPDGLSDNAVRAILEDTENQVWVGTNGSGLDQLNLLTGKALHHKPDPMNVNTISGLAVISLCKDAEQNIWVGTYEDGLNRLDSKTNKITRYVHNSADSSSLADNRVLTLLADDDYIWVGTYEGGLDRLDPKTGHFRHFRHNPGNNQSISSNAIRCLYKDRRGNIWIGTKDGLNRFNKTTQTFHRYTHISGKPGSLSSNYIRCVYEDQQGIFWIGTSEGGLNRLDLQKGTFTTISEKDGLPDNGIYGIVGDKNNNIWITTNKGLARYNTIQQKFTIYDEGDGLLGNEYSVGGYHQGATGQLYFGTFKGLNVFHPDSIRDNSYVPPVVITDLKIANTSRPHLLSQPTIELQYTENNISFEFAALSFEETAQNQYAYYLSGVDKDTVYSGTRRYVSYTNLEGGEYTFFVKAANSDGIWNEQGTTIKVYIEPPLWQQRWFRAILGLMALSLIFLVYGIRIRTIKIQNRKLENLVKQRTEELRQRSLQLEQSLQETNRQKQEAEQQRQIAEEANRLKTELTNITVHDLKNPLGGILMYTDLVKESLHDPAKVNRLINTIRETSQNMFHLISNLLKRNRLGSTFISLQKDVIDMALLVRVVVDRNTPLALHKNQQLYFKGEQGCYAEVDLDLMNDLIENLISNAIKFTPPHKNIWVYVQAAGDMIKLIVQDEGPGFRPEELQKLFRPFQRLSARPTGGENSTGLGLSIVHQIVQLHAGAIQVESIGEKQGTKFIVQIPAQNYSDEDEAGANPSSKRSIDQTRF